MDYSIVRQAFTDNGGILRTAELKRLGLHSRQLVELQGEGHLNKLKWGVYELADGPFRTPAAWDIAVDRDRSKTALTIVYPPIKVYFSEASLLQLSASGGDIGGSIVPVYDRDRTVCDVFRHSKRMDAEIVNKALQACLQDRQKNVSHLMEYARILRLERRVKEVLGIWM